jgi:dihydropteroate synthase
MGEPMMTFRAGAHQWTLDDRVLTAGIVNATPDSFSDGGRWADPAAAIAHALALVAEGADIIDIGGESTRPGATPIAPDEELRRVLPVIQGLRRASPVAISIDTWKAPVAEAALAAGADIVNDISGFTRDPALPAVAARHRAGCIVMHMRGTPQTMQQHTDYADLLGELRDFFRTAFDRLHGAGIAPEYIVCDPGFGFSKTAEQNLVLLQRLGELGSLARPLLVGTSRKSFIGKALDIADPAQRQWGTAATVSWAVMAGARLIRVHDVAAMRQVAQMTLAIARAGHATSPPT